MTSKDFANAVHFVRDLYFRLNEFTISIPPLRERREDMPFLAKRFMDIANIDLPSRSRDFPRRRSRRCWPTTGPAMCGSFGPSSAAPRSWPKTSLPRSTLAWDRECGNLRRKKWRWPHPRLGEGFGDLRLREIVKRSTVHVERTGDRRRFAENGRKQSQGRPPAPGGLQDPSFEGERIWNSIEGETT